MMTPRRSGPTRGPTRSLNRKRSAIALALALALALLGTSSRPANAQATDPDPWFGKDKAAHFAVSTVLASTTYAIATTQFRARYPPLLIAGGLTLSIGAAKEGFDALGFGDPSWKDFTWDVIGTIVGLGLAWGIDLAVRGLGPEAPAFGLPSN
jgi:putative lipoprotein